MFLRGCKWLLRQRWRASKSQEVCGAQWQAPGLNTSCPKLVALLLTEGMGQAKSETTPPSPGPPRAWHSVNMLHAAGSELKLITVLERLAQCLYSQSWGRLTKQSCKVLFRCSSPWEHMTTHSGALLPVPSLRGPHLLARQRARIGEGQ
jgi:hypothetical protein